MNPEREILNFWFNKKGYFTLHNIKVGHNREIYMLALKIEDGKPAECIHVETQISVSPASSLLREEHAAEKEVALFVRKKFESMHVKKKINEFLSEYNLESSRRMVVLGRVPKARAKSIMMHFREAGVETAWFSEILIESITALDGQTYYNNTVRTLQLVKFLIMSEAKPMAEAFRKFLKGGSKQSFLATALEGNEKMLSSPALQKKLTTAFFSSQLSKPEVLSELLAENLSKKSYNALLKRMLEQSPPAKRKKRREKTLTSFIGKS